MVKVHEQHLFKKYYVVNFSWNGWISKSIKSITQSHWAHSGIIIDVDEKDVTILESVEGKGIGINKYSKEGLIELLEDKVIEILDFKIDPNKPDDIWLDFKQSTKGYGYEAILGIFLSKLGISTKFDIVGTVICSELVSRLLYQLSDKKIKLGYNPKDYDGSSEYNIEFWRIEPKHINLSKYGERVQLMR